MKFLSPISPPILTALPAPGTVNGLFVLSSNMHVYFDNGTTVDDLTESTGGSNSNIDGGNAAETFTVNIDGGNA